jgi:hypothetical protein
MPLSSATSRYRGSSRSNGSCAVVRKAVVTAAGIWCRYRVGRPAAPVAAVRFERPVPGASGCDGRGVRGGRAVDPERGPAVRAAGPGRAAGPEDARVAACPDGAGRPAGVREVSRPERAGRDAGAAGARGAGGVEGAGRVGRPAATGPGAAARPELGRAPEAPAADARAPEVRAADARAPEAWAAEAWGSGTLVPGALAGGGAARGVPESGDVGAAAGAECPADRTRAKRRAASDRMPERPVALAGAAGVNAAVV